MMLCRISAEAVCWLLSVILRPLEEMPDTDATPVSLDTAVDLSWYDLGNVGGVFWEEVVSRRDGSTFSDTVVLCSS